MRLVVWDLDHALLDTRESVRLAVAETIARYPGVAAPVPTPADLQGIYAAQTGWDGARVAERLLRAHLAGRAYPEAVDEASLAPAAAVDRSFLEETFRARYLGGDLFAALGGEGATEGMGTLGLERARVSTATIEALARVSPLAVVTHRSSAEALYAIGRQAWLGHLACVVAREDAPTPQGRVAEAACRLGSRSAWWVVAGAAGAMLRA